MKPINNLYGAFSLEFGTVGEKGLLVVLPEMAPTKTGITPTERYFIYRIHPDRGTCTWYLEQDENQVWYSYNGPHFISSDLLAWIGKQIEEHT